MVFLCIVEKLVNLSKSFFIFQSTNTFRLIYKKLASILLILQLGKRAVDFFLYFRLSIVFKQTGLLSYNLKQWMKLDLSERTMLVFLVFLLSTDRAQITGATASGRGCPAPTRRGACPWSRPRRRGTAPSATTTPQDTTTASGPARAAKPSSKGVFKVTNCSSESPLLFTPEETEGTGYFSLSPGQWHLLRFH